MRVTHQIAIREAKRQNVEYRQHSVKALGKVAKARQDVDLSASIFEVTEPLLDLKEDDDKMDVDEGGKDRRKVEEM